MEDYEALRPIFFDHSRVEPDVIRRKIEKEKTAGHLTTFPAYNKNARAKINVTGEKCYTYFYEITSPLSGYGLSLMMFFRIGRDNGELQALWTGEFMIMRE